MRSGNVCLAGWLLAGLALSGCARFEHKLVAICAKNAGPDNETVIQLPSAWFYGIDAGSVTVPGDFCYYSMPMSYDLGQTAVPLENLPPHLATPNLSLIHISEPTRPY